MLIFSHLHLTVSSLNHITWLSSAGEGAGVCPFFLDFHVLTFHYCINCCFQGVSKMHVKGQNSTVIDVQPWGYFSNERFALNWIPTAHLDGWLDVQLEIERQMSDCWMCLLSRCHIMAPLDFKLGKRQLPAILCAAESVSNRPVLPSILTTWKVNFWSKAAFESLVYLSKEKNRGRVEEAPFQIRSVWGRVSFYSTAIKHVK